MAELRIEKFYAPIFAIPSATGRQLILRVGLSPTSVEEAVKNLRAEIPSWDFDAVRQAARNTWNEQLGRIQIVSPNPEHPADLLFLPAYHTADRADAI